MKAGTLEERYLKGAVLQHKGGKSHRLLVGPGVGNDYAGTEDGTILACGYGNHPEVAWNKAMNNFLCSMGTASLASLSLVLPQNTKESQIKRYMSSLAELAKRDGVVIAGGHTQIEEHLEKPCFTITLVGEAGESFNRRKKDVCPGDSIVFLGKTGVLGTNLLLEEFEERLLNRFSEQTLQRAGFSKEEYSICDFVKKLKEEACCSEEEICFLHDVSQTGIYGALWQLGENLDKGLLVENKKLAIKQETIEICEYLGKNPYLLDGTGGLLLVCKNGSGLVRKLQQAGLQAEVIGRITEEKEKCVVLDAKDIRTLAANE